jgi:hypothetical protein
VASPEIGSVELLVVAEPDLLRPAPALPPVASVRAQRFSRLFASAL